MNKLLFVLIFGIASLPSAPAAAQTAAAADTVWMVKMEEVDVTAKRRWANDTAQYRYNQMKYYVTTILPYLKEATLLFNELDAKVNNPQTSKKERRRFVNSKEDELRDKFEDEIKDLNETQGMLLMKLLARQTGINIYAMLKEFKNPLTAIKWQAYARVNGFNLNKKYEPESEPTLEHIMESLGYPLPEDIYGIRDIPTVRNY